MNQGTVLVVEDDPALCEVICETLRLANYHVETAENGQQALECLKNNSDIAMLISDVQMQPVDGYALLRSAKSRYPHLPVILMTAYGTIQHAIDEATAGDVIQVATGVYTEIDIDVGIDVTIQGAGAGVTIIQADVTPGTTSKGTPAARRASASSPPRPNTKGSPPLSRTTRFPSRPFSTRRSLILP